MRVQGWEGGGYRCDRLPCLVFGLTRHLQGAMLSTQPGARESVGHANLLLHEALHHHCELDLTKAMLPRPIPIGNTLIQPWKAGPRHARGSAAAPPDAARDELAHDRHAARRGQRNGGKMARCRSKFARGDAAAMDFFGDVAPMRLVHHVL